MAIVRPFRAIRPTPDSARRVAAVPYDVVDTDEARALAAGNPLSFLHVSRAEIDLPPGTDPHSDKVYRLAAERYRQLKLEAPLVQEEAPSLYLYRLHVEGHAQTGIAACYSLDEYDSGAIKKHERTRRDKEDDRTRHMLQLSAQTGPVFLTFRPLPAVDAITKKNASLLYAGVTRIENEFENGDVVAIVGPNGDEVARGIANYSSTDASKLIGKHSDDIARLATTKNYDAFITRNNIAFVAEYR